MSKFTKKAIMFSLLKLLDEKSLDKITVKDLCEECGINRNTFYYYFCDIYKVLEDLITDEINNKLMDDSGADSFYEEYLQCYHLVLEHKKALWHIYDSKSRDMLMNYFYTITEFFVTKYVSKVTKDCNLTKEDEKFIVDFYCNSIIGNTIMWMKEGMPDKKEELVRRMSVSYQATIEALVKSCMDEKKKNTSIFKE